MQAERRNQTKSPHHMTCLPRNSLFSMKLFLHHILNVLFTSPDCMAADIINTAFVPTLSQRCQAPIQEVHKWYTHLQFQR